MRKRHLGKTLYIKIAEISDIVIKGVISFFIPLNLWGSIKGDLVASAHDTYTAVQSSDRGYNLILS